MFIGLPHKLLCVFLTERTSFKLGLFTGLQGFIFEVLLWWGVIFLVI